MKKVIAFDLDGTLAASKSPMDPKMAQLLNQLLNKFQVCVISGGKFEQFEKQLLANISAEPTMLESLHIMPTCGTRYYQFDTVGNKWAEIYAENFTNEEKQKIIEVLEKVVRDLGYKEEEVWGETIEDRGSQVTYSALGQDIVDKLGDKGVELKEAWDPDNIKKAQIQTQAANLLQEFEVRIGGLTSIDVTKPGIDKAYGMRKLMEILHVKKEEILFIGDRIVEGGNDYPVKVMGIDSIQISHWQETAIAVEVILHVL